ncbi:MAG: hypothetical protein QM817_22190 [Archangium sp.]
MRTLLLAVLASGCGLSAESATSTNPVEAASMIEPASAQPTRTVIRLAQRSGRGDEGLTFSPKIATVQQSDAQVLVSSFDCGARGRWVDLVGGTDVTFCGVRTGAFPTESECSTWASQLPIGGSDADGAGLRILVRRGETVVGRLHVLSVTPTPFTWYETDAPFDVTVDAL